MLGMYVQREVGVIGCRIASAGPRLQVTEKPGFLSARLWILPTQTADGVEVEEQEPRRGFEDEFVRARGIGYASVPMSIRCRPARPDGCCSSVSSNTTHIQLTFRC